MLHSLINNPYVHNIFEHTKDFELCLDGGAKGRTLVGASFSIECLLCGDWCLSGCGAAETGRNFGWAGKQKNKAECMEIQLNGEEEYNVLQYVRVFTLLPYNRFRRRVLQQRRGHTGAATSGFLLSNKRLQIVNQMRQTASKCSEYYISKENPVQFAQERLTSWMSLRLF